MTTVVYHRGDGTTSSVAAQPGASVMETAITSGVAGIVAECGGDAMCATCHVYVRPAYVASLSEIQDEEDEMLEETVCPRIEGRSRLSCQIVPMGEIFEVDLPERQV